MPKLRGRLTIGGQILTERELTQDKNQKNRFVARQWIPYVYPENGESVTVEISTDTGKHLIPLQNKGKAGVLTNEVDNETSYAWGTLTKGYGETVGFTAGIMFRKRKKNVPLFSEEGNADAK